MFGGIDQVFGLKVNFDISKIESGNSGFECWKVFWQSFDMKIFENMLSPKFYLFAGDSDSNTYSICIEGMAMKQSAKDLIDEFSEKLISSEDFKKISSSSRIEEYSSSMAFNSFSPFIKMVEIEWGKVKSDNADIAFDALDALKIYRPD